MIKELKKISLSEILVLVLLIIILLQRCGGNKPQPEAPKIVRDTVWISNTGTTVTKPTVTNSIPYPVPIDRWNTEYLPDTSSIAKLVVQYEELVRKFLATNIQKDSVKIDSIGHVYITDSVSSNLVKNRLVTWNLKYPQITTTITIPEPKRTQWYVGGFVQGEQAQLVNQISAGLLIKNKKDQMFGGHVGLNTSGKLQMGLSSYWKIKIKQ
jgi:hypothetical protein